MSAARPDDLLAQLLAPAGARGRGARGGDESPAPALDPLKEDPLAVILAAENPLLEAARPLLRTLADLSALTVSDVGQLHELLVRDIKNFQQLCERAGFRRDHALTMRYCLCTALDEAVSQMPWAHDSDWMGDSLLIAFHNESGGGEKFFHLLGRMSQSPREYLPVLEAMYHILSLGFQGRYALMADGQRQLELIHARVLEILLDHRPPPPAGLSPHWQGQESRPLRFMWTLPVWVSACVAGVGLLILFLALQADLRPPALAAARAVAALEDTPVQLARAAGRAEEPEKAWPAETPLAAWFSPEQQKQFQLKVDPAAGQVTLPGDIFTGGLMLRRDLGPLLDTLAARLGESRQTLKIIGHTDSVPVRVGSVFRDNQHLSEERAKALAEALTARGAPAGRLATAGAGDSQPVAPNRPRGNPLNRRVELRLQPEPGQP